MKKLSVLLIIVSLGCIGIALNKSSMLIASYKVGWDQSGNALTQVKSEINGLSEKTQIK